MKELILKNKEFIIWFIVIILMTWTIINISVEKNKVIETLNNRLIEEAAKQSDEEVLITNIKLSKQTIQELEKLLESTDENIRSENKKSTCLKEQLNRLVEWLSYNLEYCNNNENLSKFEVGE